MKSEFNTLQFDDERQATHRQRTLQIVHKIRIEKRRYCTRWAVYVRLYVGSATVDVNSYLDVEMENQRFLPGEKQKLPTTLTFFFSKPTIKKKPGDKKLA